MVSKTIRVRDDIIFPIVNFPFIRRKNPASPAYGVYISQLIPYSKAYTQYSYFVDRAKLLTQRLIKQSYVVPSLRSSVQILHGRHHKLVDRPETFFFSNGDGSFH